MVDGVKVFLTVAEESKIKAEWLINAEKKATDKVAEEVKKSQIAAALLSAKQKLRTLGLTDDEIKALTGK